MACSCCITCVAVLVSCGMSLMLGCDGVLVLDYVCCTVCVAA